MQAGDGSPPRLMEMTSTPRDVRYVMDHTSATVENWITLVAHLTGTTQSEPPYPRTGCRVRGRIRSRSSGLLTRSDAVPVP